MPKSRLLNCSNNQLDDKEYLIPIQNDDKKLSGTSGTNAQSTKPSAQSTSLDVSTKPATTSTITATGKASSSRSMAKRAVSSTSASNVKPNTIMSMEDRDIVVIDNVDYKESTSNAATVIVVEKPRKLHQKSAGDIDLAELLETTWPETAGDLALAINNRQSNGNAAYAFSSGSTSTSNSSISGHTANATAYPHERNRSKNPLAHIGQAKLKRNTTGHIVGNLINLDSDGSSASGSFELNASKYFGFVCCIHLCDTVNFRVVFDKFSIIHLAEHFFAWLFYMERMRKQGRYFACARETQNTLIHNC